MDVPQKTYRRVIPTLPSLPAEDLDTLRWLTRESFELTAAADHLVVVEYSEATIPAAKIPADNAKHLARPIRDYVWREYVAVVQRPAPTATDPVCGYCPHPPHAAGECQGTEPTWCLPEDATPGRCNCAVTPETD